MSESKLNEVQCMAEIEKIIDRNQANKVKSVAKYLFSLNAEIKKYEISCYVTKVPDIRFTIIDPSNPPKRNRPFLVFRNQMEIHMLLEKSFASKYPYLVFKDSPKNFYNMMPNEGRNAKVETLIEMARDALLSRCNSLNFSVSINMFNTKTDENNQHSIGSYVPSKKDVEKVLIDLGGINISQEKLLDELEKIFQQKGLKDNWRDITIRNLEMWANQD
jgi:hypothetical protein